MKQNKMLLMMVGVILFSLFFVSIGNTDSSDRWVLYGTSKNGDHSYYDKISMKKVSKNIIKVWGKTKYSKTTKEKKLKN